MSTDTATYFKTINRPQSPADSCPAESRLHPISSALDVGPPLKILLAGQDSLRGTMKRAQHADLLNRISVRYQLRPLSKQQTTQYVAQDDGSGDGSEHAIARCGGGDIVHNRRSELGSSSPLIDSTSLTTPPPGPSG